MSTELKHPADDIGQALARASGILTVIGSCYDKQSSQFAIATSYLAESIAAIEGLLNVATSALAKLYQTCDLSVIREISSELELSEMPAVLTPSIEAQSTISEDIAEPTTTSFVGRQASEMHPKTSYLAAFGPAETAANLVERAETVVPTFRPSTPSRREMVMDQPATTYEELLAKVTAVADRAQNSPADRTLLPALEGLRADLLKMRAVA